MLAHGEYIQIVIVIIQEIHYAFRTKAFIKKNPSTHYRTPEPESLKTDSRDQSVLMYWPISKEKVKQTVKAYLFKFLNSVFY